MAEEFIVRCGKKEFKRDFIYCEEDIIPITEYPTKKLNIKEYPGVFKYIKWLPISKNTVKIITSNIDNVMPFRIIPAKKLGNQLGLEKLYLVNSGCGPTNTFKDLEALGILSRWIDIDINKHGIPVFASDGNVGRALFVLSKKLELTFIGIMTQKAIDLKMWHKDGYNQRAILISIMDSNADYYDAIRISKKLSSLEGFLPEGGAKNIGRLDFVATILYEATLKIGNLPDHYFQAVGSGVGPIAIYQAARRLLDDGRFGNVLPKIHIAQNYPFIPIVDAWSRRRREIDKKYQEKDAALSLISKVKVNVLTNRYPAYSISGGLYDVLRETSGEAYSVTNDEIEKAKELFRKTEGIPIGDASGVAIAALRQAVNLGKVDRKDIVLVHLTDIVSEGKRMKILPKVSINLNTSLKKLEELIQNFNNLSSSMSKISESFL